MFIAGAVSSPLRFIDGSGTWIVESNIVDAMMMIRRTRNLRRCDGRTGRATADSNERDVLIAQRAKGKCRAASVDTRGTCRLLSGYSGGNVRLATVILLADALGCQVCDFFRRESPLD